MTKNSAYSLPKDSKAWQLALDAISDLLPSGVASDDHSALQSLPIFALVAVVQNTAITDPDALPTPIKAWVDEQPNWRLVPVRDVDDMICVSIDVDLSALAEQAYDHTVDDRLSDVSVYRYLLVPTSPSLMSAEKKNAAAHIIDQQLTTHLRHFLDALPHAVSDADTSPAAALSPIDCHILPIGDILQKHKMACFDMDSTLIEQEVIVELAHAMQIGDQVSLITESAMRGEINFDESFAQRVALLAGMPTYLLEGIRERLTFSPGARTIIATLNALGYHTVLLSGGFSYFARHVADTLGIHEYHANELDIEGSEVTGEIQLPILNGDRKAQLVQQIAKRQGISLDEVICIGDGANDLPMMSIANLGIAYRAKPIVRTKADAAVNTTGLEGILYVLGYPELTACATQE